MNTVKTVGDFPVSSEVRKSKMNALSMRFDAISLIPIASLHCASMYGKTENGYVFTHL